MKRQITALITAALILANFTACSADDEPASKPVSSSIGEISGNSETASEPETISTPSEPQKPAEEPTFLKGPDGEPIYPSDITFAEIKGENTSNGIREADVSELTEDNLYYVSCENFGYLREPTGISYNRYESPEKFDTESPYLYIGGEIDNPNPVKRMYAGDKICGMTITEIGTSFQEGMRNNSVPFWYDIPEIKFKGEVTLTGYLSVEGMIPDYPGTEGLVTFWLDEQSDSLPITHISYNTNGMVNTYFDEYGYYSENSSISLGTIYNGGVKPADCDEALLDGITYGDKNVHVRITIDDFSTIGYYDNAVLKSLERL